SRRPSRHTHAPHTRARPVPGRAPAHRPREGHDVRLSSLDPSRPRRQPADPPTPETRMTTTSDTTSPVTSTVRTAVRTVPDQRTRHHTEPARTRPEWSTRPHPATDVEWLARAEEVSELLAVDAVARDRAGQTPHAEVALLRESGLVTLLGPAQHGGGGQEWPTAYHVIREIAAADGSIGQLLGYHYLWNWTPRLVGTPEQIESIEARAARERWFFGGAVNPRDEDVTVRDDGAQLVFNGRKSFSTGSKVSDVTVLEGVLPAADGSDDGTHVFAIVPSNQPGITFHDDWDNIGQRLTESGGVSIAEDRVPWADALGFRDREFQPRVYNTLNVPTIQLVFVNLYLGIARGALRTAAAYTRTHARAWLHGGHHRAVDEPFHLDLFRHLAAKLWARET